MKNVDVNRGIADLMGWKVSVINDSVFLEHPVKNYGFEYQQCFDVLDGSISSKALCLDLLNKYSVTFHPKKIQEEMYRFGGSGPYARCGSHEPVYDDSAEKAICIAVLKTYFDVEIEECTNE